ncbi:MAG: cysteine dioxygenase family protein [Streptosporangiales bacterium]|nr:cysteine dioxygenase family protein [Streptosporangiales bacterium]MBO0891003.1 cysteine dioxygenase family protein [Acidothermales bacterium]
MDTATGTATSATRDRGGLRTLVDAVRGVTRRDLPVAETAESVGEVLRGHLPTVDVLTEDELAGDPERYCQHVLHIEPDGSFSVVALVWLPGQVTPVHDHVSWCVVGVVQGTESETLYRLGERDGGPCLVESGRSENPPRSVCAFAPPGDIHRVRNIGAGTAVSMHVYGADIGELGSSIRRCYDLPVVT